jgi:CHAT domain-containing protein
MAGTESGGAASSVREALDRVAAEQQRLRNEMRTTNPGYVALSGAPLTVTEVQGLLDSESVLLSYAGVGEEFYLWVITRGAVQGFALSNSHRLPGLVRRYRDLVTERNRRVSGELAAAWSERLRRARVALSPLADSLSQILLSPAAAALKGRRILAMSSSVLQYLPFGALPIPAGAVGAGQAMVTRHEVVYLPSASTIGVLRQLRTNRHVPPKTVAVLADPVFAPDDPRVQPQAGVAARMPSADPLSSWRATVRGLEEDGPLPRLRFSRVEAEAIAALVPPNARLMALDFDANRSLVMSPALRDYRIVHFATHGFVNSDYPGFSGVALSMLGNNGVSEDGFLRLDQIYGLNLPVDLVVLSACQTALGKDVKGEGVVGLTRGFLYAGAASVLATLWKVDDQASAELMKRFYQGMLGPARLTPSAALRAAQTGMARVPRWRDPYYWAGYTLQGDWQ